MKPYLKAAGNASTLPIASVPAVSHVTSTSFCRLLLHRFVFLFFLFFFFFFLFILAACAVIVVSPKHEKS